VLLRLLRDIFSRAPAAAPPGDEADCNRAMVALSEAGREDEALAVYDAAVAGGLQRCDPEFDAAYRRGLAATGTPPYPLRRRARFYQLARLLDEALGLDGEIAECGCFRGLSSHLLLSRMRGAAPGFSGRGYHVFDSFEGLSEPSPEDIVTGDDAQAERLRRMCRRGWFAAGLPQVREALAAFPDVEFHPGWIPQSFAGLPERRYRFVHLDLDLHDPTLAGLEYFHPRLVPGGIIVCDDFEWPGERRAIERFCAQRGARFDTTPHGQAVLRGAR
jgi:hypothetical protein